MDRHGPRALPRYGDPVRIPTCRNRRKHRRPGPVSGIVQRQAVLAMQVLETELGDVATDPLERRPLVPQPGVTCRRGQY